MRERYWQAVALGLSCLALLGMLLYAAAYNRQIGTLEASVKAQETRIRALEGDLDLLDAYLYDLQKNAGMNPPPPARREP